MNRALAGDNGVRGRQVSGSGPAGRRSPLLPRQPFQLVACDVRFLDAPYSVDNCFGYRPISPTDDGYLSIVVRGGL